MKAIEIIVLPVKDRKKSKEFYNTLGLNTLVESTDAHGAPWRYATGSREMRQEAARRPDEHYCCPPRRIVSWAVKMG